jgi:hypothetical protein
MAIVYETVGSDVCGSNGSAFSQVMHKTNLIVSHYSNIEARTQLGSQGNHSSQIASNITMVNQHQQFDGGSVLGGSEAVFDFDN